MHCKRNGHSRDMQLEYHWIFEVQKSPVIHCEPSLLETLCVLWDRTEEEHVTVFHLVLSSVYHVNESVEEQISLPLDQFSPCNPLLSSS